MAITAADVNKLRQMTGSGLMDCKKALVACDGDMDKAVDYLREKGLASAGKKADRIAAEGMAYATVVNGVGVAVEVNCESDFVGNGEPFQKFVKELAVVIAEQGAEARRCGCSDELQVGRRHHRRRREERAVPRCA